LFHGQVFHYCKTPRVVFNSTPLALMRCDIQVSKETEPSALEINKKRQELNMPVMDVIVIDLVGNSEVDRVSSTYLREKDYKSKPFRLPPLPYAMDALKPQISEEALKHHYCIHHLGYVQQLNEVAEGTDLVTHSLEDL